MGLTSHILLCGSVAFVVFSSTFLRIYLGPFFPPFPSLLFIAFTSILAIKSPKIRKKHKIMHQFLPPFPAKTTKTITQFGHYFLLILFPSFPFQILANLVSQSVTNLPALPSPVDAYQLELMPELAVSMALNLQDLLKQRRVGNRAEQCPCITFARSKKCLAYDGRYQAALTEEAMLTFVDNSMDPRIFEQRMGGGQITFWTLECHSEECRQCVGMLTVVLRQIGLLHQMPQFPFPVPTPNELRPFGCPRLRISRSIPHFQPPPNPPPPIGQLISAGASFRSSHQYFSEFGRKVQQALSMNRAAGDQPIISIFGNSAQKRHSSSLPAIHSANRLPSQLRTLRPFFKYSNRPDQIHPWIHNFGHRHSRQASQKTETIIGERYVINCVERGEAESDQTDLLNLCTACWSWRQLPEDYFPRLINELVCQENDFCLSGWGICHQRYRNFDVLQRVIVNGQEEWKPTTISAASCCDCKVKAGSQAHSLVIGAKT